MPRPKRVRCEGSYEDALKLASTLPRGRKKEWAYTVESGLGLPTPEQVKEFDAEGFDWEVVPRRLDGYEWLDPEGKRQKNYRELLMLGAAICGLFLAIGFVVALFEILDPTPGNNTISEADPNGSTLVFTGVGVLGWFLYGYAKRPLELGVHSIPADEYRAHIRRL